MKASQATILIIIGVTGDLSVRKLLPAISQMAAAGALPDHFRILGITRRPDIKVDSLFTKTKKTAYLREHIQLFAMDLTADEDYEKLKAELSKIEDELGQPAQRLFYLAVPPQVSRPIIERLGVSGLAALGQAKLLLEKPFGVDLGSAAELVQYIGQYFQADQIYRIDHYLARETAQNIIIFRKNNALFKKTWNRDFISRLEIVATEEIGIEGRAVFYEQTGALRDLVQSHLLQLAALALMDISSDDKTEEIPIRRLAALRQLHFPEGAPATDYARRGQYEGYQAEVKNIGSAVETFVSLSLESDDPKWRGVPITLTTGKALDRKFTGIIISYRQEKEDEANQLTLHLQPDEGVELCLFAKRPGYDHAVSRHPLKFAFQEYYANLPDAYEQVLFNAFNSDHSLFTTSDEVLETWRILDAVQRAWEMDSEDLIIYKPGSTKEEILAAAAPSAAIKEK